MWTILPIFVASCVIDSVNHNLVCERCCADVNRSVMKHLSVLRNLFYPAPKKKNKETWNNKMNELKRTSDAIAVLLFAVCFTVPGVGVKCPPVEFGLELIIRCCCGWLSTFGFDVALFIVVIDRLAELCGCAIWWSRGGETGSDFTLIAIGDVLGGGVLFDTARWDKLRRRRRRGEKKTEHNISNM